MFRPECKYYPKLRLFENLRGEYSLFKPSSSFKKTNPSGIIGRVLEIKYICSENFYLIYNRSSDKLCDIIVKMEFFKDLFILAISDDFNGFCFFEAAIIDPIPISTELKISAPK